MTLNLNLLTVILITTSLVCPAMEIPIITKKQNSLELTCTQKTRQALYLTHNRALISDSKGCKIIDPTTDTIIRQIRSSKNPHLALHPNTTKFALAYRTKITLYDTQTGKEEWACTTYPKEQIASCTFNPWDDTIFACYKNFSSITCHAYRSPETYLVGHRHLSLHTTNNISFHPTQKYRTFSAYLENWCQHDQNKGPIESTIYLGDDHNFCEYSSNEHIMAKGSSSCIHILDLQREEQEIFINTLTKPHLQPILSIKFHPKFLALATLSGLNGTISYWNIQTRQLMSTMPSLYPEGSNFSLNNKCELSFSPNGNKLLVTFAGKCFVINDPFENALFIYWALKNYQRNQKYLIPNEIIYLLINTLLKG